mgnify:CR=1 FL=1
MGLKAYHLVTAEEEKTVPKLDDMYIDIGAKDREAAEALVALGYGQSDAAVAVGQMEPGLSVDEMIRRALRQLAANL